MNFKMGTKTLIIIAMLSPFAKADMDFVCTIDVTWSKPFTNEDLELIENRMKIYKCERNNILQIRAVPYAGKDINLIIFAFLLFESITLSFLSVCSSSSFVSRV